MSNVETGFLYFFRLAEVFFVIGSPPAFTANKVGIPDQLRIGFQVLFENFIPHQLTQAFFLKLGHSLFRQMECRCCLSMLRIFSSFSRT